MSFEHYTIRFHADGMTRFMIRKVFSLAQEDIVGDNPDSPMNQEVLMTGDVLMWQLRECLQSWLYSVAGRIARMQEINLHAVNGMYVCMHACMHACMHM